MRKSKIERKNKKYWEKSNMGTEQGRDLFIITAAIETARANRGVS